MVIQLQDKMGENVALFKVSAANEVFAYNEIERIQSECMDVDELIDRLDLHHAFERIFVEPFALSL